MRCEEMAELLPAHAAEPSGSLAVRRHLARCSACRAELGRYQALSRSLAGLRDVAVQPPPGLLAALEAIPQAESSPLRQVAGHVARNRSVYAGGLAVAGAALAGAVLWRRAQRRLAPA